MRRFLILILTLVVATTVLAAPLYACVTPALVISPSGHTCCDEAAVIPAPVSPCCVINATVQRVATSESRLSQPDQRAVVIPRIGDNDRPTPRNLRLYLSPPVRPGSPVPIYLQQLSLLI
jgi:hypothetical protein